MRIEAFIQKWGNGLGLRVSGAMREIPGFEINSPVTIEILEDGFKVKKIEKKALKKTPILKEKDLLLSLTAKTAHADLLAHPTHKEWEGGE